MDIMDLRDYYKSNYSVASKLTAKDIGAFANIYLLEKLETKKL